MQTGPNTASLIVMAVGFGLNTAAAVALRADRTYYGVELTAMPVQRTNAFPYSIMSHPMLTGSIVAYAGPLLDPEFRLAWWPLAFIRIVLNAVIILIEARGGADRQRARLYLWAGLLAGTGLLLISFTNV